MSSLQDKTIDSMMWNTIDKVGSYIIVFLSNLVLARLLMPEDFGCIAMLQVFIALADILVHGGFGMALIQKKEADHIDYSSVFYVNLVISIVLYSVFFVSAPYIASFYDLPLLSKVLRIQAIVLIINSFSVVQVSILRRNLRFKELAIRNLVSSFIGLAVGIVCAYYGWGVWSLVINQLVGRTVGFLMLWYVSEWRPSFEFSFASVKTLFSFGGLMMISSLVSTLFENLQSLIIGKYFNAAELGYVNQAKKLENIPSGAISSVVTQVSFPVFAQIQEDRSKLRYGIQKNIMAIQYINLPMMILLIIIAEPLILLFYGQRWVICIPYFQILCLSRLISAVIPINLSIFSAKGKGRTYLFIQVIKCILAIVLIALSVKHGIYALLFAMTLIPYLEFIICSVMNKQEVGYGLFNQIRDMLPIIGIALVSGLFAYLLGVVLSINIYLLMIIQSFVFCTVYLLLSKLLSLEAYHIYLSVIKTKILSRNT